MVNVNYEDSIVYANSVKIPGRTQALVSHPIYRIFYSGGRECRMRVLDIRDSRMQWNDALKGD